MSLILNVFEVVTKINLKAPRDTFPLLGAAIIGFIGYLLFTRRQHKRQERQINHRREMAERRKILRYKIVVKNDEFDNPARQNEAVDENGNGFILDEYNRQSGAH